MLLPQPHYRIINHGVIRLLFMKYYFDKDVFCLNFRHS